MNLLFGILYFVNWRTEFFETSPSQKMIDTKEELIANAEAATESVLSKKVLLNISQYSQENTSVAVSF